MAPAQTVESDAPLLQGFLLADLESHALSIDGQQMIKAVDELFLAHPGTPGIVVLEHGHYLGMLPRTYFLECMARALGRDLYHHRPVCRMLETLGTEPLRLPVTTPVEQAVNLALQRPLEHVYDPVVAFHPDGRHVVIDMRVMLQAIGQERKQALQALNESQSHFLHLLDNSPIGVAIIDRDGVIRFANASLSTIIGRAEREVLGAPLSGFYAEPEKQAGFLAMHRRRGNLRGAEVAFRLGGGGTRWCLMSWENSHLSNRPAILVWLFEITSLKAAQDDLRQAKLEAESAARAKSDFLATMSHEIRTPMNGVLGMLDILSQSGLDPDQRNSVAVIWESAHWLLRIIDDILDFSKIEAGRLTLEAVPIVLEDLVEGVGQTLAAAARRKGIRLITYVDPSLPATVIGDPVRLRQILLNLVANAVKFTGVGQVTLRVERRDADSGELYFAVIDSGVGMTDEQMEKLFQPFTQAEDSTTRRFGGSGLGLSICRRLTQLMGGRIGVSSEAGIGSTFWFAVSLPSADAPAEEQAPVLADLRVALDIPNPDERAVAQAYLRAEGARVVPAGDPGVEVVVMDGAAVRPPSPSQPPQVCLRDQDKPLRRANLRRAVGVAAGRIEAGSEPADSAFPARIEPLGAQGLILLADDDPINREVILRQLHQLGCAADAVSDGRQALEALGRKDYALLLTDCNMPELNGIQLTQAIREREQRTGDGRRLPIVAVTANALSDDTDRCLASGMDAFLLKPMETAKLRSCLARWLKIVPATTAKPAPAPTVEAEDKAIDVRGFADLLGDDVEAIRGLLLRYRQSSTPVRDALSQAIRQGEPADNVRALAHRLKGASGMIWAKPLADVCLQLETAARGGNMALVATLAPRLDQEWARVLAFIDRW